MPSLTLDPTPSFGVAEQARLFGVASDTWLLTEDVTDDHGYRVLRFARNLAQAGDEARPYQASAVLDPEGHLIAFHPPQ